MISAATGFTPPPAIRHTSATPPPAVQADAVKTEAAKPAVASPAKAEDPKSAIVREAAALGLKPFAEVAREARAALDAGYEIIGKTQDQGHRMTREEWKTTGLVDLDRRTVFAIVSNEDGQFSKAEVSAAKSEMYWRQWNAMVEAQPTLARFNDPDYVNGDSAVLAKWKAKWQWAEALEDRRGYGGYVRSARAAVDWLDAAGPEEKASLKWAYAKADAIGAYSIHSGGSLEKLTAASNQIVKLFLQAKDETGGQTGAPSYIAAVDLWKSQNPEKQTPSWVF